MRDKLIQGYFETSLPVVWKTVKEAVPAVEPQIARALEEEARLENTEDD